MEDSVATKAIEELNNAEYDGRTLSVSEAKPREPRQERSYNNRDSGYGNRSRY